MARVIMVMFNLVNKNERARSGKGGRGMDDELSVGTKIRELKALMNDRHTTQNRQRITRTIKQKYENW